MSDKAVAVIQSIPYLIQGVKITLSITALALGLGAVIGLALALSRVYGGGFLRRLSIVYGRIMRSLPLLVILFMLFYLGSEVVDITEYTAVVLALALHSAAYQSEIFRGALQSVKPGQMEAAVALGMSRVQGVLWVVMPQAMRRALPYWANEGSIVLKDSSLAYILGIVELMRRGEYISARTSEPLLTYIIVGIIYFIMTFIFSKVMARAEKRYKVLD